MIAYFDCFCGAAGDMLLAALLDAGADLDRVRKEIEKIDLPNEIRIDVEQVHRAGLRASHLVIEGARDPVLNSYADVSRLIDNAGLDQEVETRARSILERLVRAESTVHGVEIEKTHLHEIAAADTLIDVVGFSAALQSLDIDEVVVSKIATGKGAIRTAHGEIQNPSPAVVELLKGAPLYGRDLEVEILTPTGAAILADVTSSFGSMPPVKISSIGYGAGTRVLDIPNVVRVIVGERISRDAESIDALLLETNIDDMNPEIYQFVSEKLFEAGVDDVWITPGVGKSGRPMQVLSVLAPPFLELEVRRIIVTETSSLGLRSLPVNKWMAERTWIEVSVEGFPIRVKIGSREGEIVNTAPEYADCADVARRTGIPLKEVFRRALVEASKT